MNRINLNIPLSFFYLYYQISLPAIGANKIYGIVDIANILAKVAVLPVNSNKYK